MIYAEDMEMPLPTQEEVLICNSRTTAEEVRLICIAPTKVRVIIRCHCCGEEQLVIQVSGGYFVLFMLKSCLTSLVKRV